MYSKIWKQYRIIPFACKAIHANVCINFHLIGLIPNNPVDHLPQWRSGNCPSTLHESEVSYVAALP